VLFGSFTLDGFRYLNATWHLELDDRAWTRVEPTTTSQGRHHNALAHDPASEVLVMSGGVEKGRDQTPEASPGRS